MAFGKKKDAVSFDPRDVYTLATKALRDRRSQQARLAFRITLDETPSAMSRSPTTRRRMRSLVWQRSRTRTRR